MPSMRVLSWRHPARCVRDASIAYDGSVMGTGNVYGYFWVTDTCCDAVKPILRGRKLAQGTTCLPPSGKGSGGDGWQPPNTNNNNNNNGPAPIHYLESPTDSNLMLLLAWLLSGEWTVQVGSGGGLTKMLVQADPGRPSQMLFRDATKPLRDADKFVMVDSFKVPQVLANQAVKRIPSADPGNAVPPLSLNVSQSLSGGPGYYTMEIPDGVTSSAARLIVTPRFTGELLGAQHPAGSDRATDT